MRRDFSHPAICLAFTAIGALSQSKPSFEAVTDSADDRQHHDDGQYSAYHEFSSSASIDFEAAKPYRT